MNKKILLGIMTIGLVAMLAGTGLFTYFNDTETSTGNVFTAGTLDLQIDENPDGAIFEWVDDPDVPVMNEFWDLTNMKPGDELMVIVGIKNVGTITGTAGIRFKNVDNDGGQLGANVDVTISYGDKSVIGDALGAWDQIATGTLNSLQTVVYAVVPIESGVDDYWVIEFSIDSSVGNEIQGDAVTFDVEFSLNQEAPA